MAYTIIVSHQLVSFPFCLVFHYLAFLKLPPMHVFMRFVSIPLIIFIYLYV